jgi:hypothetical protein
VDLGVLYLLTVNTLVVQRVLCGKEFYTMSDEFQFCKLFETHPELKDLIRRYSRPREKEHRTRLILVAELSYRQGLNDGLRRTLAAMFPGRKLE